MIYVLDNYYAINHNDFCIIVESNKTVEEMVEICSAISFLFEETVTDSYLLDMNCLLNILIKYYEMENKKNSIEKDALNQIHMPIKSIYEETYIAHDYMCVSEGYIIDLYEARENCCGPQYKNIMDKWLPKGQELDDLISILRLEGIEK